jgi:voltage-gated potassium channel
MGYYLIEPQYSWHNAVYMTVISITTTGYEEVGGGLTTAGRVWTIFVLLGGVVTGAVALSLIVAAVVEGRIRGLFGRRQLEQKIASLSGHVIVCGYGRMGRRIAQLLKGSNRSVVVIDNAPGKTAQAEQDGVLYLLGDAQEESVLLAAGIEKASSLIAALPNDAANVFLTLSAHGLNKSLNIIARAQESSAQDKLTKAGATRVICPLIIGSNRIADVLLRPAIADFVEMAHKGVDLEMEQLTIKPDSPIAGKTLLDLALPARAGAMVVAIHRPNRETLYNPGPDATLAEGDMLIVIGKHGMDEAIEKLRQTGQV